ncbi:MAG: hypothetical protein D6705_10370 [Deltaproteobacteria bacterium]|nr:MAG: hypothetical protein D6705_10370 [Deltaproteobacteria bacterium]
MPLAPGHHFIAPNVVVHVFEADRPGPTALVQAAIHGDEIAGAHALFEMLEAGLTPRCGRLLVVPIMNHPAFRARTRTAPGGLDLNRCFPGDAGAHEREYRLARRFMDLVLDERPALVATLHESQKRYDPAVTPSFGQTIVYGVEPAPPIVEATVARLNDELADPEETWAPLYYPVATSSTEVIVEATGCIGLCIETWMGFDLERRVAMQRRVVELLLEDVGVGADYRGSSL